MVAALVAVLVGCGGSDDGDDAAGAPTTAAGVPDASSGEGGTDPPDGDGATEAPDVADLAPLPPAPDLVAPQPCDGAAVLCVDASTGGAGGDGTAGAPLATVGDAVAAAGPGTTIQVAAGSYPEPVVLADVADIALLGGFPAGGDFSTRDPEAEVTVLQGAPGAAVVRIERSSAITVEGFRITGGGGFTDGYSSRGGGVSIDAGSSEVLISANRIDTNVVDPGDDPVATIGGGLDSEGTGVRIVGNVVEGNTSGRGSGLSVQGDTVVDRNVVRGNTSLGDHGGGLYVYGTAEITANQVEGNTVGTEYSWGGGIIVYGDETEATLRGNVVTGNTAVSGGSGVFVDDGANATLIGELYYANECAGDGGDGLMVDSGGTTATEVTVTASTIAQHDCPEPLQGGVGVLAVQSEEGASPVVVTITDSILWGNAGVDLTAIGAEITVDGSIVESGADGEGVSGTEVATDDPAFADPAGGDLTPAADGPGAGIGHTAAP